MNKLCIAIRTLKRAHYLKQLLDSLERNVDLEDVDFYFYVDGPVNSYSGIRYAEVAESVECLKVIQNSKLPNKTLNVKQENNQTALQRYDMLSTLCPKYEHVVLLDNDLVVNKYYIRTMKTLFEQFKGDPKAGILGTFYLLPRRKFDGDPPLERYYELQDKVQYGFGARWEQGFWRETWETIKPYIEKYYMPHVKCDYNQLFDGHPSLQKNREAILKYFPALSADFAFEFAAYRMGYLGLHTEVPRHRGIGARGMYSFKTDEYWKERGLNSVELRDVGDVKEYSFRAPMRFAEDYRGQLAGEDVYVVGSGTSLDSYPDDFLDDKLSITLHLAYLKFPHTTFRGVCESPIIRWLLDNRPEFFMKKNIFTYPFHPDDVAQIYLGKDLGREHGWPAPIFVRYVSNESYLFGTTFEALIRTAIAGEPVIAGAYSTVLHSMLFAVLTMGARRIHLIGCDHKKKKGKVYYARAQGVEAGGNWGGRVQYRRKTWYGEYMVERQRLGTKMFMDECQKHGIVIKRYKNYNDWRKRHGV